MVSSKLLGLSILALLPISFAAPFIGTVASSTDPVDWVPVGEVNGKTIFINSAALVDTSINAATKITRSLFRRDDRDECGASTFRSGDGPYPVTGDCAAIGNWAAGQNAHYGVWDNTPDTHGLFYLGTCVFEAGTPDHYATWIGSSDIADITRDAINQFQYIGLVGAKGSMHCRSNFVQSIASVNWHIKHS